MQNLLKETEHFTVSQASGYRVPGYLIVEAKEDITRLADFELGTSAELMQLVVEAEACVEKLVRPGRIYVMKFAEFNPRIHFHIVPRTERVGAAFEAATGASAPYNGAALVAWLWDHHLSLGFTDADLAGFVDAAREGLA